VVGKDLANNVLLVAQGNDHPALFADSLLAGEIYWVAGAPPALPMRCSAKIRYRQADQDCTLETAGAQYRVVFDKPQRAVTPGQSVVFYKDELCLGGGVIESVGDP
jgi:tRNA-specific 2-thiouridylase